MKHLKILFIFVFFLSFAFRFYGIGWDSGYHLHPDERAIILAVIPLHLPSSWQEFFSIQSPLNPHFFAYGTFPMYLLALMGWLSSFISPSFGSYDGILYVGRVLSVFFDMGTVCLLYVLGKRLRSSLTGILASFFYGISILPIQLSHFYAVDTMLTFFSTLSLSLLISIYERPALKKAVLLGIAFGLSLTTKASAVVLAVPLGVTLIADDMLLAAKNVRRFTHLKPFLHRIPPIALSLLIIGIVLGITVLATEPYGFIDSREFFTQLGQQSLMTHDPFIFPYTLQYVGMIHYVYEIKNLVLFGQGTLLAFIELGGLLYTAWHIFTKDKDKKWAQELILLAFLVVYFTIVGNFAVGYMRYMLPLYPVLAVFAALFSEHLLHLIKKMSVPLYWCVSIGFSLSLLLFPLTFLHVYSVPNTRIQATQWILTHIPQGKTLAIEHWDDALPLVGQQSYHMLTLPLYDPDTPQKWQQINASLSQTDYLIIASMRLAKPLQKLTNCEVLPPDRCYVETALYYRRLFDGQLGFKKVADFTAFPTVPLLNIPIHDESADESFTVYDHPHVMIFKKIDRTK